MTVDGGQAGAPAESSEPQSAARPTVGVPRMALAALFITALATAQLTATKVLAFELPVTLPVAGNPLLLPGGAFAIAAMFAATDCYAELYGRRDAQVLVNVGFVMNFALLALVWAAIVSPTAAASAVDGSTFRSVMAAGTNVVAGSLVAYLISQNLDVVLFHRIREYTGGAMLWARNIGSTATSQFVDAAIFVTIAFYLAPTLLGLGVALPPGVVVQLVAGQYLLRLAIAIRDTPFVYLVVGAVRGGWTDGLDEWVAG